MENLESKTKKIEKKINDLDQNQNMLVEQLMAISRLQSDIAKQVLKQNEQTEYLYQALGLKKGLSYYSFNILNEEEH